VNWGLGSAVKKFSVISEMFLGNLIKTADIEILTVKKGVLQLQPLSK
jgi:hypothetical protein